MYVFFRLQGPLGKLTIFILASHFREFITPEAGSVATNHITDFIQQKVEVGLNGKNPTKKGRSPRSAVNKFSTPRTKSETYSPCSHFITHVLRLISIFFVHNPVIISLLKTCQIFSSAPALLEPSSTPID